MATERKKNSFALFFLLWCLLLALLFLCVCVHVFVVRVHGPSPCPTKSLMGGGRIRGACLKKAKEKRGHSIGAVSRSGAVGSRPLAAFSFFFSFPLSAAPAASFFSSFFLIFFCLLLYGHRPFIPSPVATQAREANNHAKKGRPLSFVFFFSPPLPFFRAMWRAPAGKEVAKRQRARGRQQRRPNRKRLGRCILPHGR